MRSHPPHDVFTHDVLRRLRLRHLELLDHLSRCATVRAAAELLSLSQPAATKMLQEIEEVCGTRLFERGRRGIEPNAQGRLFMRVATLVIHQLQGAGQALEVMGQGASALLNVGSTSTMSLLARAVVQLRAEQPQLLLRIFDETPAQLVTHLLNGDLHCAVSPLPPDALSMPDAERLQLEPITADHMCVVASPSHRLARSRRLRWSDLADEPWVLSPSGALTRQRFTEMWLQQGLTPPRPAIECVSFASVRWLVRFDPTLLALMRHHQASEEAALGLIRMLPVEPTVALPDVSFITRRGNTADPQSLAALLKALRQTPKPAASRGLRISK